MRILNVALLLLVVSCSSMGSKKAINRDYDKHGRLLCVTYYGGGKLKYTENLAYKGRSKKPYRIVYKYPDFNILVPRSEIVYSFSGGKVKRKTFYHYSHNKKIKNGFITYKYGRGKKLETRYYTMASTKRAFMFALEQDLYEETGNLKMRRFISFITNPKTGKPMQNRQSVIYYENNEIKSMKTWELDIKTKKMLEKNKKSIILITKIAKKIIYKNERKAQGKGFKF